MPVLQWMNKIQPCKANVSQDSAQKTEKWTKSLRSPIAVTF